MCILCDLVKNSGDGDDMDAAALAWGTAKLDQYRAWIHQGILMLRADNADRDLTVAWGQLIVILQDSPIIRESKTPDEVILNLVATLAAAMIEAAYPSQPAPNMT